MNHTPQLAMLYAFWEGEPWSFPLGIRHEFIKRGWEIRDFNLYKYNGQISKPGQIRQYCNEGLNQLINLVRSGSYTPNILLHMDYGVYDCVYLSKQYFPNIVTICELGDTPQSLNRSWTKSLKFDITITPDYPSVQLLESKGINAYFWTHCADSFIFKEYPDEKIIYDVVSTCGSRGNGLTEKIKIALGDSFFNERYFWGEEYGRVLNRGKIVFQCSQYKEITRRIFEGMACKRMVITDKLPQETKLHELFIDGEDIIYYNDPDDCIDKIRYYASHDDEREKIAISGYNKVIAHHTISKRVDELLSWIYELKPELKNDKL